jgi:hypothetical protein
MTLVWKSGLILQSPAANDPLLDHNTQPSLDLQFATSKTLDDRVSGLPLVDLQRDVSSGKSAGTYVDSTGVIRTSKANLNTYSEDATVWDYNLVTAPTAPTSDVISPAGLQSSFKLLETTGTGEHYFRLANTVVTSGSIYTQSIYIKPTLGRTKIRVYNFAQNNLVFIWDLVNNLEVSTAGGTSYSASSTAVGDGWYRLVYTDEATSVNFRPSFMTVTDSNQFSFTGDTTKGFYVTGAQLEEGSTVSPYIKTTNLPSAAPRFDHDPTTNASLGLLVEESRTNFLTNSEHLDTGWLYQGGMVAPTTTTVKTPDGDLDARLFTSSGGRVRQDKTPAAAIYTLCFYYKQNTDTTLQLFLFNSGSQANVTFDTTNPSNPTVTSGSGVMVDAGDGWFRASVTTSAATDGTTIESMIYTDSGYLWGAQIEAGAFPTSYIPTSGSTVTRAADAASITGSNFSRWYNQSEGSFVADFNANGRTGAGRIVGTNAGATPMYLAADTIIRSFGTVVGASVTVPSVFSTQKAAIGYEVSSQQDTLVVDGGTPNTSTNSGNFAGFAATTTTSIQLFSYPSAASHTSGTISRLTYYPYRLPDATLQEITS